MKLELQNFVNDMQSWMPWILALLHAIVLAVMHTRTRARTRAPFLQAASACSFMCMDRGEQHSCCMVQSNGGSARELSTAAAHKMAWDASYSGFRSLPASSSRFASLVVCQPAGPPRAWSSPALACTAHRPAASPKCS